METLIEDLKKVINSEIDNKDKYIKMLINGFLIERDSELFSIYSVKNRFDPKYTPPFRVGRKQGKAVLDTNGIEVVFFNNSEEQARKYCDYLNGY
tara:strand:- start:12867 stop:13151 length:285 start_codon:yes stop_codon:yes gene_type:complete